MHCVSLITATFLLSLAPQGASAAPLISEALYDAVGSDNGRVFVELYGEPGSSLDGLFLEGINGANGSAGPTIALSGVFPADGIWLLADDVGDGTSLVAGADLIVNFDFQNAGNVRSRPCNFGYLRPVIRSLGSYTSTRVSVTGLHLCRFCVTCEMRLQEAEMRLADGVCPSFGTAAGLNSGRSTRRSPRKPRPT